LCPSKAACKLDDASSRVNKRDESDATDATKLGAPGDSGDTSDTGDADYTGDTDNTGEINGTVPDGAGTSVTEVVGGDSDGAVCSPGATTCSGDSVVECDKTGASWIPKISCTTTASKCLQGACVKRCNGGACRWRAIHPPVAGKGCSGPGCGPTMRLLIGNPWTTAIAVDVTAPGHKTTLTVAAGGQLDVALPPKGWKAADQQQSGSSLNVKAYTITAPARLVVQQFVQHIKPAASADGTTLRSHDQLGKKYVAISRRQTLSGAPGFLTVVADTAGSTKVTVVAKGAIAAGPGVPAIEAGGVTAFTLSKGGVLHLESSGPGVDLTGTRIFASAPVAVFSGNAAAFTPDTNKCVGKGAKKTCAATAWPCQSDADCPTTCCADHMHAQLPPVFDLAKTYTVAMFEPRGQALDRWRVVAAEDGTVVDGPGNVTQVALAAGEFVEFAAQKDFSVSANRPVTVAQFISGGNAPNPHNDTCAAKFSGYKACKWHLEQLGKPLACATHAQCPNIPQAMDAKVGDPAMAVLAPAWVGLVQRVVVVPKTAAQAYVSIASASAIVSIDGKSVAMSPILGVKDRYAGRAKLQPGLHTIKSAAAMSAVVYGYGNKMGYAFAAGGTGW